MTRNDTERIKVIIRFPNWLGDCIMAAPVLSAIEKSLPDWQVDIMIRNNFAGLFYNDPRIGEVLPVSDKGDRFRLMQYLRIGERLGKRGYKLGLILPQSFSSAFIFFTAGIPERVGYKGDLRSFMLTQSLDDPGRTLHRSEKYLNLVRCFEGFTVSPDPKIFSSDEAKKGALELVDNLQPFIVIAPQTRAPSRRWGYDKYAQLIRRALDDLGMNVVLTGATDEREIVEKVGQDSKRPFLNLAGKADLLTSYEVIKLSRAYIGNDSGGAHLAAASGTYVLSISGADDPEETRPLAKSGRVVRKMLPCMPCVKNVCPRDDVPNECMKIISVEEIYNLLKGALNGTQ